MTTDLLPPAALAPAASSSAPLDALITLWLDAKHGKSMSAKTWRAYHDTLTAFRAVLQQARADLDAGPQLVAMAAQAWAGRDTPAPASFNQRLAILSSFYAFGIRQGMLTVNPIARVERRSVDAYAHARSLDPQDVAARMQAIDRTTPDGLRDYALLAIYLQTGRRLAEVAALEWQDVALSGQHVTLTFRRCKGGKTMRDQLPVGVSRALLDHLQHAYGELRTLQADAPLWPSASNRARGQALSHRAIAQICAARLGTARVHALRHTFAKAMEDRGAKVSDIQARLGHASLATTGRYLAALKQAENDQADDLARLFGLT